MQDFFKFSLPLSATFVLVSTLLPGCSGGSGGPDTSVPTPTGTPAPISSPTPAASPAPTTSAGVRGRVAFASNRDGNFEIYLMNADGTDQRRLTRNSTTDRAPALSRDGQRVAFLSYRDGNAEIYLMNADGTNQRRLTNNAAQDLDPSLSLDGRQITFVSDRDGNLEIYLMNADGTNQRRVTNNQTEDWAPIFTPLANKIVFAQTVGSGGSLRPSNLFRVDANGSNLTRIPIAATTSQSSPSLSLDGRRLAFSSGVTDGYDIYVANADGSGLLRLTSTASTDIAPVFSPDNRQIAFASNRDGDSEIYRVPVGGGSAVPLTNNSADDIEPSWGS